MASGHGHSDDLSAGYRTRSERHERRSRRAPRHSHGGHGGHGDDAVEVGPRARALLLSFLALVAVGTVVGLVMLWPSSATVAGLGKDVQFAAPGVTFPRATITALQPCPAEVVTPGLPCTNALVEVASGETAGESVPVQLQGPQLDGLMQVGDGVQLMRTPGADGAPPTYSFFGIDRTSTMAWFLAAFVVVVALVARLRGLLALAGLVFSGWVVLKFMLPAILVGEAGVPVSVVAAFAIIYVVLYLAHGPSIRTSTALAGTLIGIAITGLLGYVAVGSSRLTGVSDDTAAVLGTLASDLDFQVLLVATIIIAGLGVLNDVTITQSSAVWELRAAGPHLSRMQLFRSGMRIGRDHIASTIYTIVFAYAGASLSVLLLLYLYQRPVLDLLGTEDIATEVMRTLCSAIGLVLAVPITTAIAAATVSGPVAEDEPLIGRAPAG